MISFFRSCFLSFPASRHNIFFLLLNLTHARILHCILQSAGVGEIWCRQPIADVSLSVVLCLEQAARQRVLLCELQIVHSSPDRLEASGKE